jgi:hypothetical protein
MNCKPNDIARFTAGANQGRRVTVLRIPQAGDDGLPASAHLDGTPCWVIQPLQVLVGFHDGAFIGTEEVSSACIAPDWALRPVPGDELATADASNTGIAA